jgi:hypothetical protein
MHSVCTTLIPISMACVCDGFTKALGYNREDLAIDQDSLLHFDQAGVDCRRLTKSKYNKAVEE